MAWPIDVSPATVFHQVDRPLVGAADQGPLDAAMLVAQRDLQVKDLLAVALEAEMPRLDDAGVDRTDRDLVDLLALDPEEVGDADDRSFARPPAPGVVAGAVRAMKANRLEPGMPFGTDPVLLGNLALEEMDLRAVGGQRGKVVRVQRRRADTQQRRGRCRRGRRRASTSPVESAASPKKAATRCPLGHRVDDGPAKVGERQLRDLRPRDRLPGAQRREAVGVVHRFTSRDAAASRRSDSSGGGMYRPRSSTSAMNRRIGPPVLTLS